MHTSHADFLVAAKPAGLSFHSEGEDAGFVTRLKTLPDCAGLHPVHRLDRITSGLVLFARDAAAARRFGELFERGELRKCYLALSDHTPSKKQGWIKGGMEKGRNGSWRLTRGAGHRAITRFATHSLWPGLRAFRLAPHSGRTHQLRVAMKSLGAPILGDARYGGSAADRGYLHAWALRFPWGGRIEEFRLAPAEGTHFGDARFRAFEAAIDDPWSGLDTPVVESPA
ncbi:pseudouridine synthase [Niveibacterium sp. SC-1]|uniref:pseudouridine synthase n=1 Tax=Niveibacterium sp. SC-1 TaxID=3135646 RepID=UPI003120173A